MEPPRSRYRVIEKDGRLVVIDNGTPLDSSVPPPPAARPGMPSPAPVGAGDPALVDRIGRLLLAVAVREWDSQGRAVIAWEWKRNGVARRWNAVLDEGQQSRLARALVGLATGPLLILLTVLSGGLLLFPGLLVVIPVMGWAMVAIRRLQRETGSS